jgi:hypothetical protein
MPEGSIELIGRGVQQIFPDNDQFGRRGLQTLQNVGRTGRRKHTIAPMLENNFKGGQEFVTAVGQQQAFHRVVNLGVVVAKNVKEIVPLGKDKDGSGA